MLNKNELRAFYSTLREKCDKNKDSLILNNLFRTDEYIKASVVFAYSSFRSEIDTSDILEHSLFCNKIFCLPKCNKQNHEMKFIEIKSKNDLKSGAYGIKEPIYDSEFNGNADIIIVPALSCDYKGNRLGYGGGYYDRYLSAHKDSISIVLLYDALISDNLITEPTDMPVDIIITESRIIRIK